MKITTLVLAAALSMLVAACAGQTTTQCEPYDTACETNHGGA